METSARIKIFTSNWGREWGWSVELNSVEVLRLVAPGELNDFWIRYEVEELQKGLEWRDTGFWLADDVTIKSRLTGSVMTGWMVSPRVDHVWVRNLALDPGFPRWPLIWERFLIRRLHSEGTRNSKEPD